MGSIKINIGFRGTDASPGFRYKDIVAPIALTTAGGDLAVLKDMEAIKQSMKNLFQWRKGERILLPEYGNPLLSIVDEPINQATQVRIREEIYKAVQRFEPRVAIQDLTIIPNEDDNTYYISMTYTVPSLFDKNESLVFTIG